GERAVVESGRSRFGEYDHRAGPGPGTTPWAARSLWISDAPGPDGGQRLPNEGCNRAARSSGRRRLSPPTGSRGTRAGQGRVTVGTTPAAQEPEDGRRVRLDHTVPALRRDRVRAVRLAADQTAPDLGDLLPVREGHDDRPARGSGAAGVR